MEKMLPHVMRLGLSLLLLTLSCYGKPVTSNKQPIIDLTHMEDFCNAKYEGQTLVQLDCRWRGPFIYVLRDNVMSLKMDRFTSDGRMMILHPNVDMCVQDGDLDVCSVIYGASTSYVGTVKCVSVTTSEQRTTDETSATTDETSPITDETSATTDETSPTADETNATTDETSATTDETSATTDETSPTTDESSPTTRGITVPTSTLTPIKATEEDFMSTILSNHTQAKLTTVPYLEDWVVPTVTVLCALLGISTIYLLAKRKNWTCCNRMKITKLKDERKMYSISSHENSEEEINIDTLDYYENNSQ